VTGTMDLRDGLCGDDLFMDLGRCSTGSLEDESTVREIWDRYGRECAVMVLDSSGFTRGTRNSGIIRHLSCILGMRRLVQPLLEACSGCTGYRFCTDNVFAEFESVEEALGTALKVMEAVEAETIGAGEGCTLGVCIGIGFGRVLISGSEGAFGDQMNLASKLGEDLAGRGDVLLTREAYLALPEEQREGAVLMEASVSGVVFQYYRMLGIRSV